VSGSESYLRIARRHKPRSLTLAVLTRFAKPESYAEKILSLVAVIILPAHRAGTQIPRASGRGLVMKTALVKSEIDSIIADSVKYQAFCHDETILSEI
jgi:hypothetical protein